MKILEPVVLDVGEWLCGPGTPLKRVYFPASGYVSVATRLTTGHATEVAVVGHDGMIGWPDHYDFGFLHNGQAIVEAKMLAWVGDASKFVSAVRAMPALVSTLTRYGMTMASRIAQIAACNRFHPIELQLARWMLQRLDLTEGEVLSVSQETIAASLGVRRQGISTASATLQRAKCMRYVRRSYEATSRACLERHSCNCYAIMRKQLAWLTDVKP